MEESTPTPDVPALLREGAALFTASNYAAAADRYCQALETLVRLHGDLAPETADCYYFYGNSLLQKLSKTTENNLFGEALIEAAEQKLDPQAGDEAGDSESESESAPPEEFQEDPSSTANEVASSVDSDSDTDDLEVIWDNLESARIIYERTLDYAGLLNVHTALGELETYRENYGAAMDELRRALSLLDAKSHQRRAAELHYRLGLACLSSFGTETLAIESFAKSIEILEALKRSSPELEGELNDVLSDIRIKLEDAKEQEGSLQAVRAESQSLSQHFDAPTGSSAPAVDLGVFGKRKAALTDVQENERKEFVTKEVKAEAKVSTEAGQKENKATN